MSQTTERVLQQEIMLRLRAYQVISVASANGVYIPARTAEEKGVVARVVGQMKRLGQMTPGAPDIIVLWRGGAGMIELKRPKMVDLFGAKHPVGRPSPEQKEMAGYAAALGVNHAFCHSWDEVKQALQGWGAPI